MSFDFDSAGLPDEKLAVEHREWGAVALGAFEDIMRDLAARQLGL